MSPLPLPQKLQPPPLILIPHKRHRRHLHRPPINPLPIDPLPMPDNPTERPTQAMQAMAMPTAATEITPAPTLVAVGRAGAGGRVVVGVRAAVGRRAGVRMVGIRGGARRPRVNRVQTWSHGTPDGRRARWDKAHRDSCLVIRQTCCVGNREAADGRAHGGGIRGYFTQVAHLAIIDMFGRVRARHQCGRRDALVLGVFL